MKNFITATFVILSIYYLLVTTLTGTFGATISSLNVDTPNRNRARAGFSRYHVRANPYFRRMRPEVLSSDLGDDDDFFDLSKRQQTNSDDYGHLRFGKRDDQFDEYGHMRFGRNNVD